MTVEVEVNGLAADLGLVPSAGSLVIFAHGSGSSRFSPRNRQVAEVLRDAGLATLLMDLLTPEEDEADRLTREHRFDIPLLGRRLAMAMDWVRREPDLADLPIGLFGASTGAAAALVAAAERPDEVGAVVSRGGRPDLAGDALPRVKAPTLLIVGERDELVITLNVEAAERLHAPHHIEIIPGATHLFEEPGALEQVARLTADFFTKTLAAT